VIDLGTAAFIIVVAELVVAVAAALVVRRFWRQVRPQVAPLVQMIGLYSGPATMTGSVPTTPPSPAADTDPVSSPAEPTP